MPSCIARTEEHVAGHARIGRIGVDRIEVRRDELAQSETARADRQIERAHASLGPGVPHASTLPGLRMPLGSSAALHGAHHGQFHRIGAPRELGGLQPADAVLGADAAAERSTRSNIARFELGPRARNAAPRRPGSG